MHTGLIWGLPMKMLSSCLLVFTLALLSACGGDNNSTLLTASGVVINEAPMAGALVCIDVNENLSCDDDEPSTTTDGEGTFELQYSRDYSNRDIVVDVKAGQEVEIASIKGFSVIKGTAAPLDVLLTASNDASVVSPLTTLALVRSRLENIDFKLSRGGRRTIVPRAVYGGRLA